MPLYLDVYFFNWTNPDDFLDDTTKPMLEELGPYRFREFRDKVSIEFHDNNSTVSYRTKSTFYFDEDGSNGTLDDVITQLNIVAVSASAQALHMEYVKRKHVSLGLKVYEQELATSKTARELLFEGYEDNMVLMGREGLVEGFEVQDNPYDRIGWFYLVRIRFEEQFTFDSARQRLRHCFGYGNDHIINVFLLEKRDRPAQRHTQRAHRHE